MLEQPRLFAFSKLRAARASFGSLRPAGAAAAPPRSPRSGGEGRVKQGLCHFALIFKANERPPIAAAFRMIHQIALLLDFAHVNAIEPLDCGVGHFFKRCVAEWRRKTC